MVGAGLLLVLAVVVFWVGRWRGRDPLGWRWFLRFCAVAGPLAVVALEAGWVATEVGRQPWIVYDVMRTAEAATDRPGLWWLLGVSTVVYAGMTVAAVIILRSMARRWRAGEVDLPSPYGPEARLAGAAPGDGGALGDGGAPGDGRAPGDRS
jgi:cytochrome d ubiquinol oxidase subunit I